MLCHRERERELFINKPQIGERVKQTHTNKNKTKQARIPQEQTKTTTTATTSSVRPAAIACALARKRHFDSCVARTVLPESGNMARQLVTQACARVEMFQTARSTLLSFIIKIQKASSSSCSPVLIALNANFTLLCLLYWVFSGNRRGRIKLYKHK